MNLPIFTFLNTIINLVNSNPVVIVKAETGSGKSTQIPQALYQAGYNVVVTQPRRVAARSVATRVAAEMNVKLGSIVGFRTGFEKQDSKLTDILFCTDALQFSRELHVKTSRSRVLVIDEVHEWNLNIEALVAWCKQQLKSGFPTKIVIMSATLDTSKLQEYFNNCPVIEVPGKNFPVETLEISLRDLELKMKDLVEKGKNILVFLPGKGEIEEFISKYNKMGLNATFLPMHGELTSEEQDACFKSYANSKVVVATNIAQTSITIPDIDVVVDFGLERRVEYVNGVEGLYLRDISQADCLQRKGRAGRVRPGVYILVSDTSFADRIPFSVPEIQRLRIESVVLKFLSIGIEIEDLELFHKISYEKIAASKRLLESLGAIENGRITEKGKKIASMPLNVEYSCMLLEAEKRGILMDMITVVSILESGNLFYKSRELFPVQNRTSDILDRLSVFNMLEEEYFKTHDYSSFLFKEINRKNYRNIVELRKKLLKFYKDRGVEVGKVTGNMQNILLCYLAGSINNIFVNTDVYEYENGRDGIKRRLDNKSVISPGSIVIGEPRDFQVHGFTIRILSTCSRITADMIMEVFPDLLTIEKTEPYYDQNDEKFYIIESYWFNGFCVKKVVKEVTDFKRREVA